MKEAKTSSDDKVELIILELQILTFQIHLIYAVDVRKIVSTGIL